MGHPLTASGAKRRGKGLLLGLTGSSGSGQTTASKAFADCGFEILSLDEAGHRLLGKRHIREAIAEALGDSSLAGLDAGGIRAALRKSAFELPDVMDAVVKVLHPRMSRWISLCSHKIKARMGYAVIEGALLMELGGAGAVDQVVVMASEPKDCLARIVTRDGLDEHGAARRLALQMPLTERLERADWVILNSAGTSEASVGRQALAIAGYAGRSS